MDNRDQSPNTVPTANAGMPAAPQGTFNPQPQVSNPESSPVNSVQNPQVSSYDTQPVTPLTAVGTDPTQITISSADIAPSTGMSSAVIATPTAVSSADVAPVDSAEAARVHAALSHPYFSNGTTQPSVAEGGDIIIGSRSGGTFHQTKSRRKVIGIVAVMLAAVATTLIVIFATGKNSGQSSGIATSYEGAIKQAGASFNQYANYILYSKQSDQLDGEYDLWGNYNLSVEFNGEYHDEFWSEAKKMLANSVDNYKKAVELNNSADITLLNNLQQYQQSFLFLAEYHGMLMLSDMELYATYWNNGAGAVEDAIATFNNQNVYSNSAVQVYFDQKTAEYNAILAYLNMLSNTGCMQEDGVKSECPFLSTINQDVVNASTTINDYQYESVITLQQLVKNVEANCWSISQQIALQLGAVGNE